MTQLEAPPRGRPESYQMEVVVKLVIVIAAVCAGLVGAMRPAGAQTFGQFTGAEPVANNGHLFGAYIQSSNSVAALLTQLRLSFYPGVDFGFMGGLTRQDFGSDSRTTLRLGTDLKVLAAKASETLPVTVAVGGNIGIETGDNFSILTVGPSVVASRSFPMGENGNMTPYGSIGFAFSSVNIGDEDDSDLAVPVRLGSDFQVSPQLGIVLELQFRFGDSINDDVGFAGGVNLPF